MIFVVSVVPFNLEKSYLQQGAQKIIFTACHSGKLRRAFTGPDVISTSPQNFLTSRIDFKFLKKITCRLGKLKTEFISLIAKSTSPGLSDTTFFACCSGLIKGKIKIKNNNKKNCSFVLARYCLLRGSCAGLPTPFSLAYFKMANAASPSDYSSLKHAITMGCSTSHGLSNSTFVTPWDCK